MTAQARAMGATSTVATLYNIKVKAVKNDTSAALSMRGKQTGTKRAVMKLERKV